MCVAIHERVVGILPGAVEGRDCEPMILGVSQELEKVVASDDSRGDDIGKRRHAER